jgi:hypothetical protein
MSQTKVAVGVVVVIELMFIWHTCVGVWIFFHKDGSIKGVAPVNMGLPKTSIAP